MYNERERLFHHQQLLAPGSAAADLRLLRQKSPRHPRLAEFSLSPARHADAILFELLAVASRDEIVKNRLQAPAVPVASPSGDTAPEPEPEPEPAPAVPVASPSGVDGSPSGKKKRAASRKKTNTPG